MNLKIMITGRNQRVSDEISEYLEQDGKYELAKCWAGETAFKKLFMLEQPSVIIICLGYESPDSVRVYDSLGEYIKSRPVAIIVVANDKDANMFSSNTRLRKLNYLARPVSHSLLDTKLKIIEKKLEAMNRILEERQEKEAAEEDMLENDREIEDEGSGSLTESDNGKGDQGQSMPYENRRKRILIADNDHEEIIALREYLRDSFDVSVVMSGADALHFLETHTADLIILAYTMQDMNGPLVLKRIRASVVNADIPVAFISKVTDRNKVVSTLVELKPQGYILKPVFKDNLIAKVNQLLSGRAGTDPE